MKKYLLVMFLVSIVCFLGLGTRADAITAAELQSQIAALQKQLSELQSQSGQSSLTVISPNGGEVLTAGLIHRIKWTGGNSNVDIYLLDNPTRLGKKIFSSIQNNGYIDWTVNPLTSNDLNNGGALSGQYVIWVGCSDNNCIVDDSDSYFRITNVNQPSINDSDIASSFPSGLNYWMKGIATGKNNWDGTIGTYTDYCTGSGLNEYWIFNNLIGQSPFGCPNGCSNGACLGTPTITSCSADGMCVGAIASSAKIMSGTQTSSLNPIILGTANGTSQIGVVLQSNFGDKVYGSGLVPVVNGNWSVTVSPALTAGQYTIRVYDANNLELTSGLLSVIAPITVASPNGGEMLKKGQTYQIKWSASSLVSKVNIILVRDKYQVKQYIATGYSARLGTISWKIPTTLQDGGGYTIKI